ncbi:hypothetical protein L873DRAFT_1790325 [Choiromyces venosus 120613-1]|uniref:Uncharacterized protein n=1 Tax=Choiromyces venosus 120613-1 TaxID=1336337 RepID=A0A3N4JML6_9PEZI|nr:hypothetical protein L873DRAFT_1790325 [Choiromyces venosus 120613-1]
MCHLGLHVEPTRIKRISLSYKICEECSAVVPECGQKQKQLKEGKQEGKKEMKEEAVEEEVTEGKDEEEWEEEDKKVSLGERGIAEIERWREGVEGEVGDGGSGMIAGGH